MTDETDDEPECIVCGMAVDTDEADIGMHGDPYALYSGYNLSLEDDDEAGYFTCSACAERVGVEGDSYILVLPQYGDDPEAGEVMTMRMVVTAGIACTSYRHGGPDIDPEGPFFGLVSAMHRNVDREEWPTEWLEQYHELPDDPEWRQVSDGWHSSMEKSPISEKINALTSGDAGVYGPVLVKIGQTRNVCTVLPTVYAPKGTTVWSGEKHERVPLGEWLTEGSPRGGAFGHSVSSGR